MALITLSNINKAFGDRDLFVDASFFVNDGERVALIGANGTGKSTLLKMIISEVQLDSGTINCKPGMSVGYLPQDVNLPEEATLHQVVLGITPELLQMAIEMDKLQESFAEASESEAAIIGSKISELSHRFDTLGGYNLQSLSKAILHGLGFQESEFDISVTALSGGQKTRAALARILLNNPDILLLDEPTNHLDIQAADWLQEHINNQFSGAALIVSHDRYFMDKVISRVLEIEAFALKNYNGNYSSYAKQKEAALEDLQKSFKEQRKEINQIEEAIQTLFSHRKFTRRDSKVKQLERIKEINKAQASKKVKIRFAEQVHSGRDVVRLKSLTKQYPGKELFTNLDLLVERGQKLGIVGPNGSGKSTLLKIIAGILDADDGEINIGYNVDMVYFAQQFDHLNPQNTVIDELANETNLNAQEARNMLAKFLFLGDDAFKKVEYLSGGEKCRLAIAKVIANNPNLLILDEPTNHLDIASREVLEHALHDFKGTIIVASHDRYLLDKITNRILEIKDGKAEIFLGNYSDYREKISTKLEAQKSQKYVNTTLQSNRPVSSLKQMERELRESEKHHQQMEKRIHWIENRMADITVCLGNEECYKNGTSRQLSDEYDLISQELEKLYADWEQILARIEELKEELGVKG